MLKFFLNIVLFSLSIPTMAQITVSSPENFDAMEAACIQYIQKNNTQKGFRLQIGTTNTRTDAQNLRSKVMSEFPDQPVYVIYKQPTFRVRLGDFRNRWEAMKSFIAVKQTFPAVFIVSDDIEINVNGANTIFNEE